MTEYTAILVLGAIAIGILTARFPVWVNLITGCLWGLFMAYQWGYLLE